MLCVILTPTSANFDDQPLMVITTASHAYA